MNLWLLIGSLAAIVAVALIVRALEPEAARLADDDEAKRWAEESLPGFVAREALVSVEGDAALVIGEDDGVALVKRHGAHFAARQLARPLSATRDGDRVEIDSREARFGRVRLTLSEGDANKLLTMM